MIGDLLDGRYRVLRLLGRGGMGAVYEARHEGTGRRVAVKVIEGATPGDDSVRRFQREARAAGAIDTQHAVQVLDSGADPATGAPFMVMEYLEGEDLQHLLDRAGVLPAETALRIVAQVCLGLQKAHEAGVVHRDVKPANVFLARREEGEIIVKILDFGIAKLQPGLGHSADLTATGGVLGSPRYLAPEQARASRGVDHRADLWSLGVVLYRAVSGHALHERAVTAVELIMMICTDPPTPVQQLAPWVAPGVAAVLDRALRIPAENRFPRAAAMLDALRPLLPGGWSLREDMLVPLDATARDVIAPRFEASSDGATASSVSSSAPVSSVSSISSVSSLRAAAVSAGTPGKVARIGVAAIAGAALLGLGALGAFMATRSVTMGETPKPPPQALTMGETDSAAAFPPAVVAAAPSASAPAPVPSAAPPPALAPAASASAPAAPAPVAPAKRPAARRPANNGFDPTSPL